MQRGRQKILILVIAILFISNAITIYMLINRNSTPRDRKKQFSKYLKNRIGFNDQQIDVYDSLADHHFKSMKAEGAKLRKMREEQYVWLAEQDFSDSSIRSVAQRNSETDRRFQEQMLMHIRQTRSLCTPEQRKKFDTTFFKEFRKRKEK